jgi:hypothetical protein
MLAICHRVVITVDIQMEWRNHSSNFSLVWLAAMQSRGKVVPCDPTLSIDLRTAMTAEEFTEAEEAAVFKDMLLVVAALETDRAIVSRDEKARHLYTRLAKHVPSLRSAVWINPVRQDERPVDWLKSGARLERKRRLGSQS